MSTTEPASPRADDTRLHIAGPDSGTTNTASKNSGGGKPQISVVVLSKDEPELALTLDLLRPQCAALNAECIVVDASERRLESIRLAHPWVVWMDYSGPFWRSSTIPHQRNVGCRAASGDIIAFCDAGGEPDADWLATITAPLSGGTRTLVCGPVFAKRVGVYSVINDALDGEIVHSVPTGNMAFLKTVFSQMNGFNEQLFYGSDLDFSWRCADAGHPCYQVRAAGMVMDFGDSPLTMRRSWRYGRAWIRLWDLHPDRHSWIIKNAPERVIYPVWILLGPLSLLAAMSRKLRWAPLAWLGLLGLLLIRNRKAPGTYRVVVDHIVGGASTLNEAARRISGDVSPVVFLPEDETNYLRRLSDALSSEGVPVSLWKEPTRSGTINLLLGPLWILLLGWRGVKVLHIHWTYKFSPSSDAILGRLARWWFGVFLASAHAAGVKIVWTAHNLLPHEPVFDDDIAARKMLAAQADAVIALSPHGAEEISELFGATNVTVIPLGPLDLPASPAGRDNARQALGVEGRMCFTFFGYLRPYKGIEDLIVAAERLGPDIAVIITGQCDADYVAKLASMVAVANAAGADVHFDPRWRSEDELADILAASDVCVFPFVRIDNSGSALLAQASGLPIIIPDLASLQHLDNPGVLRFDHTDPVSSLKDAMANAAKMDQAELGSLGQAAREWAAALNWT
ncbi:MAG TPA: glycosyltransferase, partial [Chloroflexota bacterium]|nr:glycosyltransferase [Chloroflexota bacterium]